MNIEHSLVGFGAFQPADQERLGRLDSSVQSDFAGWDPRLNVNGADVVAAMLH